MQLLGSKISLISKSEIRYEGILFTLNPNESTLALAKGKISFITLSFSKSLSLLLSHVARFLYKSFKLNSQLCRFVSLFFNLKLTFVVFPVSHLTVRMFGTENRPTDNPVQARDEVFEFIIFRGQDIKDIRLCEPPAPQPTLPGTLPYDPAIVQVME